MSGETSIDLTSDELIHLQTILLRDAGRVINEADARLLVADTTLETELRLGVSWDLVQLNNTRVLMTKAKLAVEAEKVQDHFTRISAALALAIGAKNESRPHAVEAAP